jgi:hypothetical protein
MYEFTGILLGARPCLHISRIKVNDVRQKDAEQKVWAELGVGEGRLEKLHNKYFDYYYSSSKFTKYEQTNIK